MLLPRSRGRCEGLGLPATTTEKYQREVRRHAGTRIAGHLADGRGVATPNPRPGRGAGPGACGRDLRFRRSRRQPPGGHDGGDGTDLLVREGGPDQGDGHGPRVRRRGRRGWARHFGMVPRRSRGARPRSGDHASRPAASGKRLQLGAQRRLCRPDGAVGAGCSSPSPRTSASRQRPPPSPAPLLATQPTRPRSMCTSGFSSWAPGRSG